MQWEGFQEGIAFLKTTESVEHNMASKGPKKTVNREVLESGEVVIGKNASSSSKFSKPVKINKGDKVRSAEIRKAQRKRASWEQSEVGSSRTKNASDLSYNVDGSQGVNMPVRMVYELLGFNQDDRVGPAHYDVQLPGMSDPNAAPRPPRWDELTPEQQSHTHEALRRHGTSIDTMTKDFGAQVDQAYMRARKMGSDHPFSEYFYEPGSVQSTAIRTSAKNLGIPTPVYAAIHGMTSPNTKFQSRRGADHPQKGETYFPNDESAENVVRQIRSGIPSSQITNKLEVTGMGPGSAQAYVSNMRKAGLALEQFFEGKHPSEWNTSSDPEKFSGPFDNSPKAGPYANTQASDSHPEYLVSDVHTGGGGMLPHLSAEKPVLKDAQGNVVLDASGKPKRDKSEREKAIASIPYFHAASDYAARTAMQQRGLSSVRRTQAAQWGEEQIQRGLEKESEKYPKPTRQSVLNPDQLSLF